MYQQDDLLQAMAHLTEQVQCLHMELTVQRSGYLLLARQLAVQGHLRPGILVDDLQTMGQAQPDAGWQDGHASLAAALLLAAVHTARPVHGHVLRQ